MNEVGITARIIGPRTSGFRRSLAALGINLGDNNFGPLFREAFGSCPADTTAAASDECNFPG
jgi:hypothetical protein